MSIIDRVRAGLKKKGRTAQDIEADLSAARTEYAAAKAEADSAKLAYPKHLLESEAAAEKHRRLMAAADDKARDLGLVVARLEEDHQLAASVEDEAARVAKYAAADERVSNGRKAFQEKYHEACRLLLEALLISAECDEAVRAANEDLPAGANRLKSVEDIVRTCPAEPEQEVARRRVSLWCRAGDTKLQPLREDEQARVSPHRDGTGLCLPPENSQNSSFPVRLQEFDRVEFRRAQPVASTYDLKLSKMVIRQLRARDFLIWDGERERFSAAEIRERLAALDAGDLFYDANRRPIEVRLEPIQERELRHRISPHLQGRTVGGADGGD